MREEERGDEEMRALGEEMENKKGEGEEGERRREGEGRKEEGGVAGKQRYSQLTALAFIISFTPSLARPLKFGHVLAASI